MYKTIFFTLKVKARDSNEKSVFFAFRFKKLRPVVNNSKYQSLGQDLLRAFTKQISSWNTVRTRTGFSMLFCNFMSFISVLKRRFYFVFKFTYAKLFKRFSPATAYGTKCEFQSTANVRRSDFNTRRIHVAFRGASVSFPESNECNCRKQFSDFPPWRLIFLPPVKSHAGLPVDLVR